MRYALAIALAVWPIIVGGVAYGLSKAESDGNQDQLHMTKICFLFLWLLQIAFVSWIVK
jgi:hypothetical protein